jgi:hypothetical protein
LPLPPRFHVDPPAFTPSDSEVSELAAHLLFVLSESAWLGPQTLAWTREANVVKRAPWWQAGPVNVGADRRQPPLGDVLRQIGSEPQAARRLASSTATGRRWRNGHLAGADGPRGRVRPTCPAWRRASGDRVDGRRALCARPARRARLGGL